MRGLRTKKSRDYIPPIFHFETLEDESSMGIVMQIISGLETANIAFGAVFYNEEQDNINVHTYNMSMKESKTILQEVCSIDELKDYEITLN